MASGPNAFVVRLQWRPKLSTVVQHRYQVLKLRGAKIGEMADYRTLGAALKSAKVR